MATVENEITARLAAIGMQGDDRLDIGETALLLAHLDLPDNNLADYRGVLADIAGDLGEAAKGAGTLAARSAALSQTLYEKHGFQGDVETYDDPQNANLMRVIDRRKGLPVALGILVVHAARTQGWDISGLNFPGHFLLRMRGGGEQTQIDPFDGGRILDEDDLAGVLARVHGRPVPLQAEFLSPISDRDILLRLPNNIKIRALNDSKPERAMQILHSMTLFAPAKPEFLAELALLEASSGQLKSALERLDGYLLRNPDGADAARIQTLKSNLDRSLN